MGRQRTVEEKLRRPRAKDDLRVEAIALRSQGATYDQIAAALSVSKSTCSLWLLDLPHDLVVAVAVSYWCEGGKNRQWNRHKVVQWMNSDPLLVTLYLEGLAPLGVTSDRLSLRVHIHESADEEAARAWWSERTGVAPGQFRRSTIKRHNPKSVRLNVGDAYRGCLCVTVLKSRALYEVIDGLMQGLATQPRFSGRWHDEREVLAGQQDGADPSSALV